MTMPRLGSRRGTVIAASPSSKGCGVEDERQSDEPPADVGTEAQERDPEIGPGTHPDDDLDEETGATAGGRP
jgi:hypothetical protein